MRDFLGFKRGHVINLIILRDILNISIVSNDYDIYNEIKKKVFISYEERVPNHRRTFWCSVRRSYYLPSAYEVEVIAMSLV